MKHKSRGGQAKVLSLRCRCGVFRAFSASPLDPSPTHTGTVYVDGDGADVGVGIDIVVDVVVVVDIDIIVGDEGASGFASRAFPSRPVLSRHGPCSPVVFRCPPVHGVVTMKYRMPSRCSAGGFFRLSMFFLPPRFKKSCFLRLLYMKEGAKCHSPCCPKVYGFAGGVLFDGTQSAGAVRGIAPNTVVGTLPFC